MADPTNAWDTRQVADAVQGELQGENVMIIAVSTDTRKIQRGELFVALRGPNFDGHDYLEQAKQAGAVAAIVDHPVQNELSQIVVQDTRLALGDLARAWRRQFSIPVIGVTGSNGKTTVKELCTAIMSQHHKVHATQGNFNNDIGMPLTLLKLNAAHTAAVIEMGANHHGEIDYLTHISLPTVAIITNAGPAHLEGFGSIKGVSRAKGEIYSGLDSNGTAIINADDIYCDYWRSICQDKTILTFGLQNKADVFAAQNGKEVVISTPDGIVTVEFRLPGEHNLMNALAATAACLAAGASLADIENGLESAQGVKGRLQLHEGIAGSRIIDDTYNANPASLYAALEVLGHYPGKHFLALGDMGELGSDTEQMHAEAGEQARSHGVSRLYAIGENARFAARHFGEGGCIFNDHDAMVSAIADELSEDVTLLVKGSRLMHMENIVNALTQNGEN